VIAQLFECHRRLVCSRKTADGPVFYLKGVAIMDAKGRLECTGRKESLDR
jgi:hypothetical protein